MNCKITFSDATPNTHCDSVEDAVGYIRSNWPNAVIGHDGDLSGGGDRTMFWRNEDEADNDDGGNALGSIRLTEKLPDYSDVFGDDCDD